MIFSHKNEPVSGETYSKKSHFIAGILCLAIGRIGIHRFYVGKYLSGTLYVLLYISKYALSYLEVNVGIAMIVSLIPWFLSAIDLMMINYNLFTDSDGRILHPDFSKAEPDIASEMFSYAALFYIAHPGDINVVFSLIAIICSAYYLLKADKSPAYKEVIALFYVALIGSALILCLGGFAEERGSVSKTTEIIEDYTPTSSDVEEEEPTLQAYSNTLSTGHYLVGIDIPTGTYTFQAKRGFGNIYTDDGSLNLIFDASGENEFSTDSIENIYLSDGVLLSILGNQEVSCGCSDADINNLRTRDQSEDLKEIEIGYGWFTAGIDFESGTYDLEWIEGNGNLISEFSEEPSSQINEIMGDADDFYIDSFEHLYLPEGVMLKIDDIKIKLTPSK